MGDVLVIAKISPKNNAFTGVVDASQVLGGTGNKLPDNTLPDWVAAGLDGATGNTGPVGPTGASGATWLSGVIGPTAGDGKVGDFWLNTSNGDVLEKKPYVSAVKSSSGFTSFDPNRVIFNGSITGVVGVKAALISALNAGGTMGWFDPAIPADFWTLQAQPGIDGSLIINSRIGYPLEIHIGSDDTFSHDYAYIWQNGVARTAFITNSINPDGGAWNAANPNGFLLSGPGASTYGSPTWAHDLYIKGATGRTGPNGSIDLLTDVDTSGAHSPTKDWVLKWNGSSWVPALYNQTFVFSIATMADDQGDPQLIGSGVWGASGAINFTASYNNPPPTAAYITQAGTTAWGSQLDLTTPFTSVATTESTLYPAAKDSTVTFTLHATNTESDTKTTSVTFRNNIAWGVSSAASGWTGPDVVGLTGAAISNTQSRSVGINGATGEYLMFAFPSTYTNIHATGFLFNSITCPFESPATVSVTNTASFVEDYKVYRSTLAALGNYTLITSTSSNLIDPIYYGVTGATGGYTEANIEGLAGSAVSNTKGRIVTVTAGAGEYIVYALPTRLGTVTFKVGGFEGGFLDPETLSVTNSNGYTENYYVYRSSSSSLGVTELTVT